MMLEDRKEKLTWLLLRICFGVALYILVAVATIGVTPYLVNVESIESFCSFGHGVQEARCLEVHAYLDKVGVSAIIAGLVGLGAFVIVTSINIFTRTKQS